MKSFFYVLKKEIVDCIRDKRSILMMILPILIFPLLLTIYNTQIKETNNQSTQNFTIASETPFAITDITQFLVDQGFSIQTLACDDATDELKSGKASCILNRDENGYHIIYDQSSISSTKILNILISAIETIKMTEIETTLEKYGENTDILYNYNYIFKDISQTENSTNFLISLLGPTIIIMFIATGGSSIAIDLFCGEKERGSFEGLLATQINRNALYLAKLFTVFLFVCFNTLISIGGYFISFAFNKEMLSFFSGSANIGLSLKQISLTIILAIVFAFFIACVISVLSLGSKTIKEGSLRISLFTMLPTLIGSASMYIENGSLSEIIGFIPIINSLNSLKNIFMNSITIQSFLLTVLSTFIYGIIFLLFGFFSINSEKILN